MSTSKKVGAPAVLGDVANLDRVALTKGLSWGGHAIRLEYEYSPVVRPLEKSIGGRKLVERILRDRPSIEATLRLMRSLRGSFGAIAAAADPNDPQQPHWCNGWLPGMDAGVLYSLIVGRGPKTYLEVGSGNSTKFVRRAIRDHGLATRIVSVDPQPRAEIDAICDEVVRSPIEKIDVDALAGRLSPGDVIFVDNSHRGFQNSDVTISFMELMPALPKGVIFGVHDICLPFDYDSCFLDYFYNEQYYLGMYLLGGAPEDTVLLPTYFAGREHGLAPLVAESLDHPGIPEEVRGGSSFWMELGAAAPSGALLFAGWDEPMITISDSDIERLIEDAPAAVMTADGQLTPMDRLIYYWAAREFYTGTGTIVDGGALVGGTTTIFGEGILANPKALAGDPLIHVYDLFEDDHEGYSAKLLKGWYGDEQDLAQPYDFERHFRRNTAKYEGFVKIHKGDITASVYDDPRDIEILSIDVAKNADLMQFCAVRFFPRLLPGRSVILHQDYVFPFQPWLHMAMEMMGDIVRKAYDAPDHCTSVFVPKRPITEEDVRQRLGDSGADYYSVGNARYLYKAIEKARPGYGQFVHTAALAYFYAMMGQRKTAIQVATRMLSDMTWHPSWVDKAALRGFLKDDLGIDLPAPPSQEPPRTGVRL